VGESGVSSAPGKGGEAVDGNGCSMLSESPDLNEVCASRVGTLTGEAGIGESKLWPKSSSQWLGGISEYPEFRSVDVHRLGTKLWMPEWEGIVHSSSRRQCY
jgi:hypothetical protein